MGTDHSIERPVILFDGVCNFCNSSVQFIVRRDKKAQYLFASLQSDYAKKNLPTEFSNNDILQSIVLKEKDTIKTKSTAVLTIAKRMPGLWPFLYIFIIVPKFLRDWVYDIIARNRYKWFGKKSQCMVPPPEWKDRFID